MSSPSTPLAVTEGMKEIVETLLIASLLVTDGGLSVPARLARHADSAARGAGFAVGTFMLFPLFGFSINTLSLFGLVLAIGLVVDDAIVVVEAVERHIEEGMAPKEGRLESDGGDFGPGHRHRAGSVRGVRTHRLHPRHHRKLYQQFAVTIAISVILSAFNALTLSPALAALLLKPKVESHGLLRRFFDWFNRLFGPPRTAIFAGPAR
jgi:HAE1 family hydrophobic/amphiphilic exporter-1